MLVHDLLGIAQGAVCCAYAFSVWQEARERRGAAEAASERRQERYAAGPILIARDRGEQGGQTLIRERWRLLSEDEVRLWIARGRPALDGRLDPLAA